MLWILLRVSKARLLGVFVVLQMMMIMIMKRVFDIFVFLKVDKYIMDLELENQSRSSI